MTTVKYLEKAERALRGARLLLADGEHDGACNRAYYAMFDGRVLPCWRQVFPATKAPARIAV